MKDGSIISFISLYIYHTFDVAVKTTIIQYDTVYGSTCAKTSISPSILIHRIWLPYHWSTVAFFLCWLYLPYPALPLEAVW